MSQTTKLPRPTGLPFRVGRSMAPPSAAISTAPPFASRRGSLSRPVKAALRLPAMVRDVKSVQDFAELAAETTCVRKTASYSCLNETKRKLEPLEPAESAGASKPKQQVTQIMPADSSSVCSKLLPAVVMADCEKVLQSLYAKAARNSSEFDDSVASFLSEQTDLLDVRLDISVASVISEVADRTPSVEDLPMECEVITPGAVISAMSLDTGYQGDGELSRPESRNAESEVPDVPALKVHDDMKAMTDSDFFTESDADGHDESGLSKRDRKAQVIDGTLYGGPTERSLTEDMESSGIYSDLERKPEPPAYHDLISQQIRTIQSIVISHRESTAAEPGMVKSSSGDSSSTIQETPTVKVSPAGSVKKETIRKNKMPNRNVESKVKTLLAVEPKIEAKPRTTKPGKWDAVMDKIAAGREKQPSATRFRDVKSKVFQTVQTPRGSTTPSVDGGKMRSRRSTRVRSSESSLVSPKSKQSRLSANSSPHSSISDLSASSSHPSTAARVIKKREGSTAARDHAEASSFKNSTRTRETNVGVSKGQVTNNNGTMKGPVGRRPNTPRSNPPLKGSGLVIANELAAWIVQSVGQSVCERLGMETVDRLGKGWHTWGQQRYHHHHHHPLAEDHVDDQPFVRHSFRNLSFRIRDVNQNGVVTKSTSSNSITSTTPNINNNTINFKAKVANRLGKSVSLIRPNAPRVQKDSAPVLRRHLADSHKAVEALAALLNYCAHDLDAFKTPSLKKDLETVKCRMQATEDDLCESKAVCQRLEEQLQELQETVNQQRASDSQVRLELETEQKRIIAVLEDLEVARANCQRLENEAEIAQGTVKQLRADEAEYKAQILALTELSCQFDKVLNQKREADESLSKMRTQHGTLIETLQDKEAEIKLLATDNVKLREKVKRVASEKGQLRSEVERLRCDSSMKESEKIEIDITKKERLCVNQRLSTSELERLASPGEKSEHSLLSEVESLRQVLALKTEEVSELRRLELHLRVEADRVPKLLSQVTTLEAKVEDLQSQLSSQLDVVRNLNKSKETLQEELKTEVAQKTRLSHKNEELQYKLRVNSEAMWQLVNRTMNDERALECSSIGNSPRRFEDARPQMMGVVQKSESVSYMLDMGEDTAEVVSNIVRRAESARTQTLPKKKRARTLGSADTPASEYYSCGDSPSGSPSVTPRRPARSRACVRLLHSDFATDSIDLPREADCEVIEISGSFDRAEPDMSCSTSSNSSSNFDIESEVYPESPVLLRFPLDAVLPEKRLDPEGEDNLNEPIEPEESDEQEPFRMPLAAAGEAMVSSDEEELK